LTQIRAAPLLRNPFTDPRDQPFPDASTATLADDINPLQLARAVQASRKVPGDEVDDFRSVGGDKRTALRQCLLGVMFAREISADPIDPKAIGIPLARAHGLRINGWRGP